MLKNKLIYIFFLIFFILSLSIDYSIFKNKKIPVPDYEIEIIEKSTLIIRIESNTVQKQSSFFQARSEFQVPIRNEISKYINNLISKSEISQFQFNDFNSRFVSNTKDKYFTYNHNAISEDWFYGKLYFEIKIFTNIKDEEFTSFILGNLKSIFITEKHNIFNLINNLTENFLSIEENRVFREYSKLITENNYRADIKNDLNIFLSKSTPYDPNLINPYKKNYLFVNFVPVFSILFIFSIFIVFIFLIIKRNLKI